MGRRFLVLAATLRTMLKDKARFRKQLDWNVSKLNFVALYTSQREHKEEKVESNSTKYDVMH